MMTVPLSNKNKFIAANFFNIIQMCKGEISHGY